MVQCGILGRYAEEIGYCKSISTYYAHGKKYCKQNSSNESMIVRQTNNLYHYSKKCAALIKESHNSILDYLHISKILGSTRFAGTS